MTSMSDALSNAADTLEAIKPRLRGWLHLGTFPLVVAAGVVLVCLASGARARTAAAIYAVTAALLFGVSALYHRGHWQPRARRLLKRIDHSNIFLIIAGTYTPIALLILRDGTGRTVLWVVWIGAIAGVLFRVLWTDAPRWLYTPLYVALGWVAIFVMPQLLHRGGVVVVVLIATGGLLYSLGGLVYGLKRPDPWPQTFGFHEIFHALTITAFVAQYVAVSMAVYSA